MKRRADGQLLIACRSPSLRSRAGLTPKLHNELRTGAYRYALRNPSPSDPTVEPTPVALHVPTTTTPRQTRCRPGTNVSVRPRNSVAPNWIGGLRCGNTNDATQWLDTLIDDGFNR
ncbi:unnamed protein product [Heligmosomoides polygyrus]|uniref:Transposase n=1 Tax=Heligmosomoides polygyrus TaxID=6339 RepID=A0A183G089_HELPZ|nr:unnamed protein product [Heligmosomoides polygyrus]